MKIQGWYRSMGGVLMGSFLVAVGLVWFLIPNRIAAGGVSGLATVVFHLTGLGVGVTMLLINIPLFFMSMRLEGVSFGLKSLVGTLSLSVFVDLLRPIAIPLTRDPLLAAIYGGAIMGVGLGVAFRSGGTTGGTDLAAVLIHRSIKTSVGTALLILDGAVIALAGLAFSAELAMIAALSLFTTGKVIDLLQGGVDYAKAAIIISDSTEAIAQAVLTDMDRGVTGLQGRGMYTRNEKEVLLVVVGRNQVIQLKALVAQIDPKAFVILTDVVEALGEGFKEYA